MADIVTFRDITERRKSDALRARLATIVESSSDAIVGMTAEGIVTSWNRAAEHIFGVDADTACGRSIRSFILLGQGDIGELLDTLRGGRTIPPFEAKGLAYDGTPVELSVAFSTITCRGEDIQGLSAIVRDITLAKERSRDLAVKSAVLERLPCALLLVDAQSRITFINKTGIALWGYANADDVSGVPIDAFARDHEAPGLLGPVRNAFIHEDPAESEVTARRVDGTSIRIRVTAKLVRDALSIPLCLTITCQEIPVQEIKVGSGQCVRTER
ncbi:MAG: PAS domain S-box protein [Methanobacteriota archaeon]|nr:MAG: PAS domain S-box protein [Euryarchaeota archaeon]